MRRREKTLAGMFLKYISLFCINTLLLAAALLILFEFWLIKGIVLPANFGERFIQKNISAIVNDEIVSEEVIPEGCFYGVYDSGGTWQYGTFSEEEQTSAWEHYLKNQTTAEYGHRQFYSFYERKNGEIAIVRIYMTARFAGEGSKNTVLNPETLLVGGFVVLFLFQAFLLAKIFAKQLKRQLRTLQQVTEKIADSNLEFETAHSDVREIEQVFLSLNRMRDALKTSLEQQWEAEQRKRMQLSALAHDIKTPLAVIRGNAELLAESGLPKEEEECNRYILQSAKELEHYFVMMRQVLASQEKVMQQEAVSVEELKNQFLQQAERLCRVYKVEWSVQEKGVEGKVSVEKARILRVWNNLLENALEYTKRELGIKLIFGIEEKDTKRYFVAKVVDYGKGFSREELRYGTEEFYRGDNSRSDREHQGLGLSIARKFAEAEGGFVTLNNSEETGGAMTALWLPVSVFR